MRRGIERSSLREDPDGECDYTARDFASDICGNAPPYHPDAYVVNDIKQRATWIEVDDKHPTTIDKTNSIAHFNDLIISECDWELNLLIVYLYPMPMIVKIESHELMPDIWRYAEMKRRPFPFNWLRELDKHFPIKSFYA